MPTDKGSRRDGGGATAGFVVGARGNRASTRRSTEKPPPTGEGERGLLCRPTCGVGRQAGGTAIWPRRGRYGRGPIVTRAGVRMGRVVDLAVAGVGLAGTAGAQEPTESTTSPSGIRCTWADVGTSGTNPS